MAVRMKDIAAEHMQDAQIRLEALRDLHARYLNPAERLEAVAAALIAAGTDPQSSVDDRWSDLAHDDADLAGETRRQGEVEE